MENTFYYSEPGTRKFFHRLRAQSDEIKKTIEETIEKQIATNFSKTKMASRLPYEGHKLYECRVNVGKLPALRVAFTVYEHQVFVVFITNQIQKSDFSKALETFLKSGVR